MANWSCNNLYGLTTAGGARTLHGQGPEMAREVIRILQNKQVRRQMADAGPKWVAERFSRERMVEDYLRFFQLMTGAHEGRS